MSTKELNAKFDQWNPMENDYKDTEFNHYISGLGAELHAELQPSQQALQNSVDGKKNPHVPSLVFKYLPKDMTKKALYNICSRHGCVTDVRDSTKNEYYFVDLATVSDMEAVFRALDNNNYGFKVVVSKANNKPSDRERKRQNFSPVPPSNTGIDYESRNFCTSKKNHPRPQVKEDSSLNENDAIITGLPLNLLVNDAHSLERQGLYKMPKNNKFNYRNGRSYVNMPDKVKQFIDKKHKESSGTYNDSEDKFVHTQENNPMPSNINKCSQCYYSCDTVCERCSQYYCSVECQLSDWPVHRYICGKPKHLQKTPPSIGELQTCGTSTKTPKENNLRAPDTKVSKVIETNTLKGISPEELTSFLEVFPQRSDFSRESAKQPSPSSKNFPQVPNCSKPASKKLPACLRASKQFQNTSNESSQKLSESYKSSQELSNKAPGNSEQMKSTQQLSTSSKISSQEVPICSKPASKKIPACLRASKQLQNNSDESSQKLSEASKSSQELSNKAPKNSEQIYKQNMPRSGNIVSITSIIKTNLVFIRSTAYDDNLSFFNTVDTLQALGKKLPPLKTIPKSGEVVIAKFEDQFNRVLVLKINNPTNIFINFMDYGNTEQARMEDLYEAPKELVYKPRHAIPIVLKEVTDFYMTEEIRQFMHSYLNNINVEIHYKPEDFRQGHGVYAVELIDENTQQNLNKMIMKLSKPVQPQNLDEICERGYLKSVVLPVGNNVKLIVMDNSLMLTGCVSCTTKPYAIEIDKFKKEIQDYVESIPKEAYTPRAQELCIAQYNEDRMWYRGLCIETVGDGHPSIHFIDYGNITVVPIESIRRYPRQFTYPMYTFDCAIEGLPESCDVKIVEKLEDLLPNGEIIECANVTVDEENNFYSLSLPNVIRELTECGLI